MRRTDEAFLGASWCECQTKGERHMERRRVAEVREENACDRHAARTTTHYVEEWVHAGYADGGVLDTEHTCGLSASGHTAVSGTPTIDSLSPPLHS